MKITKTSEYTYEVSKNKSMNVPVKIFSNDNLIKAMQQDDTIKQAKNMAKLPGIINNVVLLPDAHQGYGAPIGTACAFDINKGVISPGATGFDINCGVRVLLTNINKKDFMKERKRILSELKKLVPSGLGKGGKKYSTETIKEVLVKGSYWALENKMATNEDIIRTEENGRMQGVNIEDVSQRAISRGLKQLGTLGAGNHFIDIHVVDEIYDLKIAKNFGIKKDTICFMIHCGSRGLGHQVASDYIKLFEEKYGSNKFPDRELGYAPIKSEIGKKYFSAMKASVNFAFCNRQIIMFKIQELLKKHFPSIKSHLLYDVAHNISKIEKHKINNKIKEVLVVRKGATRSFGKGRREVPEVYRKIGQPVIIPGSMSTPSYVLAGTKKAEEISFGSSAHGAGRAHSRAWAHKTLKIEQVRKLLQEKDIILEGGFKGTIEESEFSYKDVEEVIEITHDSKISKKVAKLNPIAVMIG